MHYLYARFIRAAYYVMHDTLNVMPGDLFGSIERR